MEENNLSGTLVNTMGAVTTTNPYTTHHVMGGSYPSGLGGSGSTPSVYPVFEDSPPSTPRKPGYQEFVSRVLNQLAKTISVDLKKNYQVVPKVNKNIVSLELIDEHGKSTALLTHYIAYFNGDMSDTYVEMGIADLMETLMMKGIMTVLDEAGFKIQDL